MYVKSITLKNFKKFTNFTANFTSDITVVKGPNEQGKSTLLAAFLAGFFYDPKKSNKDIQAFKSWQSEKLYEITIDIEHRGETIRLFKDFEHGEILLENTTTKKKLNTFGEVSAYLYEIGALRSAPLFERTACVRHDELTGITEGKKEISRALEELMTASGEHVSADKIIKKVEEAVAKLQRGMKSAAKSPGLLKQLETDIAELSHKKTAIARELEDAANKQGRLVELEEKYRRAATEVAVKKAQYEKNAQYFKTKEELKQLHAQFDAVSADVHVLEELQSKKEYIVFQREQMKALQALDFNKLYTTKETVAVKKEKLARAEEEEKILTEGKEKQRMRVKPLHLIGNSILFIVGFLGFLNAWLYAFFGLFAVLFVYSFILKKGFSVHTRSGVHSEAESLRHEIAVLEKQFTNVFQANNVANEQELVEKAKKYNAFGQELEKLESKEEGILRSRNISALGEEKNNLARTLAQKEAMISDEEKLIPPFSQVQRSLELEMKTLERETERLHKEMGDAAREAQPRSNREDLVRIEEELAHKQEQQQSGKRKLETLEVLAGVLQEAQKQTVASSRAQIEATMKKYLPAVTDGRYHDVKLKDDFSFEVWSGEKGSMITPEEHLSKGTIDQFYLVARLAVLELLNKGVKSLILLDDPFFAFDAKRKERAREILTDVTGSFQIILFTHSSEYDGWGTIIQM